MKLLITLTIVTALSAGVLAALPESLNPDVHPSEILEDHLQEQWLIWEELGGSAPRDTLLSSSVLYSDSVERHFYYAVPSEYDISGKSPLLVWLHGGVSTQELRTMEPADLDDWPLMQRLLDEGFLLAFPCGQMEATWWDTLGEKGILDIVKWMKLNFNVDDSRVFTSGFSDGASGSFSLMMLHPSPFAGYLAFSGHPGVAAIDGERSTYFPCLSNRPGIVTHTDLDGLYPSAEMAPAVAAAESAGAVIDYYTFQGYQHDPAYLPEMKDEILAFLRETQRKRFPGSILWEAGEPCGCDWLWVDSIVPWPVLTVDVDHNLPLVSERLTFGFYPDWEYEGDGVYVSGVVEDSDVPAARLGFQEGDVIVGFQGSEVKDLDEIGDIKESMAAGDSFSISIQRGGSVLELRDRFNPPQYYWLLPRYGPSARIEAEYSGNVFTIEASRLCTISLLLHPDMVDFDREVAVVCNGHEIFRETVVPDSVFALENLLKTADTERAYLASVELDLEELLLPKLHASVSGSR